MANAQRRKGLRGEAEVAAIWRGYADVQDLQHNVAGLFDQVVLYPSGLMLLSDPKRQEKLRLPLWINQAETNFASYKTLIYPQGFGAPRITWIIPFRQSGSRWHPPTWYAAAPLEDLARLLA